MLGGWRTFAHGALCRCRSAIRTGLPRSQRISSMCWDGSDGGAIWHNGGVRTEVERIAVKPRTATLVDLFCGAGGLSLGFCRAGIRPIHAIDHWKPAVDTYRSNLGDHVVLEEITEDTVLPESTLIAGGPPCQGFSSAGRRNGDDKRNTLVTAFAQLVVKHKPTAFVFENVEGFLTGANGSFVFELLSPLLEAGYRIHLRKINAANYGVPQLRKRVIGIGGLGWSPSFPEPTHTAYGAPGADLATRIKPRTPTIADALDGLPVASSDGREKLLDHIAQPFTGLDLERARLLKPVLSPRLSETASLGLCEM